MIKEEEIDDSDLSVYVRPSPDDEAITLHFESEKRNIVICFNIQTAQLLSMMLAEEVTAALLRKMQLFPPPSENIH